MNNLIATNISINIEVLESVLKEDYGTNKKESSIKISIKKNKAYKESPIMLETVDGQEIREIELKYISKVLEDYDLNFLESLSIEKYENKEKVTILIKIEK